MAYRGNMLLHASAVTLSDGMLLFTGDTGSGKSTLASSFHRDGKTAVADDCVKVICDKHIRIIPSYGGLRLWDDSVKHFEPNQITEDVAHYSTKKRISINYPDIVKHLPVLGIIVLSKSEGYSDYQGIKLTRLSIREGYLRLFKQLFRLDVNNITILKRDMDTLGEIVDKTPIYHLELPHDYDLLPTAKQLILETILAESGSTPT